MSNDYELFKGKNLSSLFEDIYNNQLSKKAKISALIEELKKMIRHAGDVASVGPIISSLIDSSVKNDDQLVKLATIATRIISAEKKTEGQDGFLSEFEKNNLSSRPDASAKKVGWVLEVLLDENAEYAKTKKIGSQPIGSIHFKTSDDGVLDTDPAARTIAHPFDKNFKNIPIVGELVEIYEGQPGSFYYRRIGLDENPTKSAFKNALQKVIVPKQDEEQTVGSYKEVSETGITKTNAEGANAEGSYGKYYDTQENIHRLKLYEGDSLIETRFGQSIRFSGFNNFGNKFSPTIILRNGENAESGKKAAELSTEEDINRDGSIIALTSGQYQLPFVPGVIDDKGKTNFGTKPDSFGEYPTKLIGDQILINSGRIILSAKNAEMLFFSKKNYGFISDGAMSIDNKLGIDVSVGDDIHIVTNDKDINMVTGKGAIFLGSEALEPMVKGQQLVDILAELIDAITQQIYLTPSGPSAAGPTNISQFGSIKSKLNNILSRLNQTS
jgi:hypothetical protein